MKDELKDLKRELAQALDYIAKLEAFVEKVRHATDDLESAFAYLEN